MDFFISISTKNSSTENSKGKNSYFNWKIYEWKYTTTKSLFEYKKSPNHSIVKSIESIKEFSTLFKNYFSFICYCVVFFSTNHTKFIYFFHIYFSIVKFSLAFIVRILNLYIKKSFPDYMLVQITFNENCLFYNQTLEAFFWDFMKSTLKTFIIFILFYGSFHFRLIKIKLRDKLRRDFCIVWRAIQPIEFYWKTF